MSTLLRIFIVLLAMGMGPVTTARADFITGYGWVTTDVIASSGTAATAASLALGTCSHGTAACTIGNADVSFTTTGIKFSPPGLASTTIATWLTSSAFPLNNVVDNAPTSPLSPSIWMFVGNTQVTGTSGSPQSFTFQHDDGMTFVVNGQTVVNAPGPTGPVVTTGSYTGGASMNAAFTLIYSECCRGSAVLATNLVGPQTAPPTDGGGGTVPEPTSLLLLTTGAAAIWGWRLLKMPSRKILRSF
jgi:PEP-CTERM motif-containing protein